MTIRIDKCLLLLIVAVFSLPFIKTSLANQTELPESTKDLVDFSAALNPSSVHKGEKTRLVIDVDLKPGWHIYSVILQRAQTEDSGWITYNSIGSGPEKREKPAIKQMHFYRVPGKDMILCSGYWDE